MVAAIGRFLGRPVARFHRWRNRKHDPELIINNALRRMKERQIRNRERAVAAMTQANLLRITYFNQRRVVAELLKDGRRALKRGEKQDAADLLKQANQEKELLR